MYLSFSVYHKDRRQVASSYGATQVHFNPKLPEVNALLQRSVIEIDYS